MGLFDTVASTSPMTVAVPPPIVWISRVTPGDTPTWGNWTPKPGIFRIENLFRATAIVGQSFGAISLLPTVADNTDAEDYATILCEGDRVAIGLDEGGLAPRWLFAGYVVRCELVIDGGQERAVFRIAGPEWWWGADEDSRTGGGWQAVYGQTRRNPAGEDEWILSGFIEDDIVDWYLHPSLPTVFNPRGRGNMSITDVSYGGAKAARPFDEPDRRIDGENVTERWVIEQAAKYLVRTHNYEDDSRIELFTGGGVIAANEVMPETDVDGMTLWGALRAVGGAKYSFYVDPIPVDPLVTTDSKWHFTGTYFSRTAGDDADFWLDERFTPVDEAHACITRLHVSRDISKVVNDVSVRGRRLIQVCLRYHGAETDTVSDTLKKTRLQPGWADADGKLDTYSGLVNGLDEVTPGIIDSKGATAIGDWADKYTTTGKDFPQYQHVFRMFTWNESAETTGAEIPDLEGVIAVEASKIIRRRRPPLDTIYKDGADDNYRRVPPTLYMAFIKPGAGGLSDWVRVSSGNYRVDPTRAAVWITVEDIAKWTPFENKENPDTSTPMDPRSFATLLRQGTLRMALVCCVDDDVPLEGLAARQATSGGPWKRYGHIRKESGFVKIGKYNDGEPWPGGSAGDAVVDDQAIITSYAQQLRSAGEDAQIRASIVVAADWPYQALGKFIPVIQGRNISLLGGAGGTIGRAPQIVAATLDTTGMKWEYLTEDAALALRAELMRGAKRRGTERNRAGRRSREAR